MTDQPQVGALISSDTPNDMDPMKSLRVVRSQSHTSMERRRSLSAAFSLLSTHTHTHTQKISNSMWRHRLQEYNSVQRSAYNVLSFSSLFQVVSFCSIWLLKIKRLKKKAKLVHSSTVLIKHIQQYTTHRLGDSQGEGLVPAGVERWTDGPGLLFGLILWVWYEFEFNIRVW